nr:hypothetical protein D3W47_13575 [Deinococcus sp. RM]
MSVEVHMRRIIPFLPWLFASFSQALTLHPAQAGPGEPVVAVVNGAVNCEGLRVFIGSRKAPADSITCDSRIGQSRIGFALPESPKLEAAPGLQVVSILQKDQRPPDQPGTPNFAVLPPRKAYLLLRQDKQGSFDFNGEVVQGLRNLINATSLPKGFEYLTPLQRDYIRDKLDRSQLRIPQLPPLNFDPKLDPNWSIPEIRKYLERPSEVNKDRLFSPPSQVLVTRAAPTAAFNSRVNGYRNQVCGKDLYVLDRVAAEELPIGAVLEYIRLRLPAKLLTAPDTMGVPPASSEPSRMPSSTPSFQTVLSATGWSGSASTLNGAGVRVFILDTLDGNGYDSAVGATFPGHGRWIKEIIKVFAGGTETFAIQVCSGRECQADRVVTTLCDIGALSAAAPSIPHLINFSMAATNDNPILRGALQDVMNAGVAVVAAFGNNDRCLQAALRPSDFCNALPADLTSDNTFRKPKLGALYSVGAAQQNNAATLRVQRGERLPGNTAYPWGSATVTRPSISAPGSYIWDGTTYQGTSFATPVVTAALALWAQKHTGCVGRWPTFTPGQTFLNIETLLQAPCPQ